MGQQRPNILMIVCHDLGDWLGTYGFVPSPSPRLDKLAEHGARLTNCFSSCPICCPSRATMLSGRPPQASGMAGQVNRGWDMRNDIGTLPGDLCELGYETRMMGFSHGCAKPTDHGYDEFDSVGDADKASQFAAWLAERGEPERPFFCHLNYQALHRPYGDEHDPELPGRLSMPGWLPDDPELREDLACFHRYVQQADAMVGHVLDVLDDAGLAEDTLVIFTTDHGAALPRAKQTLFDAGLRIASLWRWPGVIGPGQEVEALLSNQDYRRTIVELAGGNVGSAESDSEGRSFSSLLTGRGQCQDRNAVFAEHSYGVMYKPMRAVRTERYKYIASWPPRSPHIIPPFTFKRLGTEQATTYFGHATPEEELYDLENDPDEQCNLAGDPARGPLRNELRSLLLEHMRRWNDPLLEGPIADPSDETTPGRTFRRLWSKDLSGTWEADIPDQWDLQQYDSRS